MQTITPVSSTPEIRPVADDTAAVHVTRTAQPIAKHRIDQKDVAKLEHALAAHDISLKFSRDEVTKSVVVELIDQKTGEAVRQFPTEVSLSLAANFMKLQGVFLDVQK